MPEKFDVCIVGGGVIGLAIANQLVRRKQRIVILEKAERLATEASSNNGGSTWPFAQMLYEPQLYQMVRDGVEAHKRLSSSGLYYHYRATACVFAFFETGAMQDLIKRLESMPSTERFDILTKRDLLESESALTSAVIGGVRFPDCSLGEAGMLCSELIRELTRAGVEARTSAEVVGFTKDGKNIKTALSKGGDIAADKFVLAAGPWSGSLSDQLGIGIPTIPIKGHLLRWKTEPSFISNMVWTGRELSSLRGE